MSFCNRGKILLTSGSCADDLKIVSGDLDLNGNSISNSAPPTSDGDLVNKTYVDLEIGNVVNGVTEVNQRKFKLVTYTNVNLYVDTTATHHVFDDAAKRTVLTMASGVPGETHTFMNRNVKEGIVDVGEDNYKDALGDTKRYMALQDGQSGTIIWNGYEWQNHNAGYSLTSILPNL